MRSDDVSEALYSVSHDRVSPKTAEIYVVTKKSLIS